MDWLRPISHQGTGVDRVQHLLPPGSGLVTSACGRRFNRDFAVRDERARPCVNCERKRPHR